MPHPHKLEACKTIREALLWASSFLEEAQTKDPRFEAELLLRHCLQMERTAFLASMPDLIGRDTLEKLGDLLKRRASHEPIQYMIGEQGFYGRDFLVAPGVLIPRPETEILVEQILQHADRLWEKDAILTAVDLGTGSGAITLTLACERRHWQVSTVDISSDALDIARKNAARFGVGDSVRFLQGNLTEPLIEKGERFDILVSNPPYIPSTDVDELEREVQGYEPRLALDGGTDGLDFYRRICEALPALLKETALVGFEVGIHQAHDVKRLMVASGLIEQVEIIPDLAGIDRVVIGWRTK
ncbi:peptide chain release factor N(5)-glutamine methyltransferase [Brevibacillus migulae]|uniref:peptide chain release factor N(5)-glutamine methyltransferase n=1 Tax=Brevibacillus migulae TaxID=1644114 RepID=UPI00106E81F4|nr:peptide chain release factor N(5)-glutamine methyltransferase [Brevibacillus migulae]